MDLEAIIPIMCPICTLNVFRRTNNDLDCSIKIELIRELIIVIANSSNASKNEHDVSGNTDVVRGRVSLDGIVFLKLKQANAIGMSLCCLLDIEGRVQKGRIGWTIVSRDKLESEGAESVVAVKIGSA
jgi:hypothetical protein